MPKPIRSVSAAVLALKNINKYCKKTDFRIDAITKLIGTAESPEAMKIIEDARLRLVNKKADALWKQRTRREISEYIKRIRASLKKFHGQKNISQKDLLQLSNSLRYWDEAKEMAQKIGDIQLQIRLDELRSQIF